MKILLIGHSVFDIIQLNNSVHSAPGGIYYSVRQIMNLSLPEDQLFVLSQIDKRTKNYFMPLYEKLNTEFLQTVDKIPTVKLILSDKEERKEIYENRPEKLNLDLVNFELFDAILINMITGSDLNLDDLKLIRKKSNAIIFLDVHTLTRPMNEDGRRVYKKIDNFNEWAENVDLLQANEVEFNCLSKNNNEFHIAREILDYGVKIILVTKGTKGVRLYSKINSEIISFFISSELINKTNTVGCGDTFGASFFYNYIRTKNAYSSLSFAVSETEKFLMAGII